MNARVKPKLFAVLETTSDEDDENVLLFKKVFVTRELARAAIEAAMLEEWDMMRDPNGPAVKPPVLRQSDENNFWMDQDAFPDYGVCWEINEVEVA